VDEELLEISRDLEDAEALLKEITETASEDPPPDEKTVWLVYLKVEKSVALLKLYLSIERPGVFVSVRSTPEEWSRLLRVAFESLGEARRLLAEGRLAGSLEPMRSSRNCLRAFLRDRRKVRLRTLRMKGIAAH